jgi:DNA-directed RNA polymerase specialized sigma24 family protein
MANFDTRNVNLKEDPQELNSPDIPREQEQYLLETVPLIRRIINRKLNRSFVSAADDISQKVFLKLWKWISRSKKELTGEEWQKLANTATQNEIKTFYSHKSNKEVLSIDDEDSIREDGLAFLEGDTELEVNSLAVSSWKEIKNLSLRQKYALLLQKQELIFYLVASKCCQIDEVAEHLQVSNERFLQIFQLLPLSDEKISEIFFEVTNEKLTTKQIWEARSKARTKLYKVLR